MEAQHMEIYVGDQLVWTTTITKSHSTMHELLGLILNNKSKHISSSNEAKHRGKRNTFSGETYISEDCVESPKVLKSSNNMGHVLNALLRPNNIAVSVFNCS